MIRLQEWIHAVEVGGGARYVRLCLTLLGILALTVLYDAREYQNLNSQEAMDAAQVARNLSQGHGFTTKFVRPASMGLIERHRPDHDPLIKNDHPDLANAPLYPLLLAGYMKLAPFDYAISKPKERWFQRYEPDLLIAFLNQAMFLLSVFLAWRLAAQLFDRRVAGLTAATLLGADLLWRFSVSGHSTMLALLLMVMLVSCLVAMERGANAPTPRGGLWLSTMAALSGLLGGLLLLTRYSLGVLIIGVLAYLAASFPRRRLLLPAMALLAFLLTVSPWLTRNWQVSGTLFGVAPLSIYQETQNLTGDLLERQFEPGLQQTGFAELRRKFVGGAERLVRDELPRLGGSWVAAFFLVGLMVPFVNPILTRIRWFALGGLVLLSAAQIMSRTHLSLAVPDVNSENLVVLLLPLISMFGVALFVMLLEQLVSGGPWLRRVLDVGFVGVMGLPLLVALLPPRTPPIAHPPYYPPALQGVAEWFEPDELIMTDMPWAIAWYGNRQSVMLTTDPDRAFLTISDWQKPVRGLYFTRRSLDARFLTGWILNNPQWGHFLVDCLSKGDVPPGFPLRKSPKYFFPEHFLLADRVRWQEVVRHTGSTGAAP